MVAADILDTGGLSRSEFGKSGFVNRGERWRSIAAVALVHIVLAYALLSGLSVRVQRLPATITQLIAVQLLPPPPVVVVEPRHRATSHSAAPVAAHDPPGGSTGPSAARAPNPVAPIVAVAPTVSPGGDAGHGTLSGTGSGGGTGGQGSGNGQGGTDLEKIAGEIKDSDYPRAEGRAGIGGRVEFRITVGVTGRVTDCAITRSSGNAELDVTTCRLVMERFRFRPSTDAAGRPIETEADGDHLWTADRPEADEQN